MSLLEDRPRFLRHVFCFLLLLGCGCSSDLGPDTGPYLRTIGIPNNAPGQLHGVLGTGADAKGRLYVADGWGRIVRFAPDGSLLGEIHLDSAAEGLDVMPTGEIVVCGYTSIMKLLPDGHVVWSVPCPLDESGDALYSVVDLAVGPFGEVAAVTNLALHRYGADGTFISRLALLAPTGVALDGHGNAHVAGGFWDEPTYRILSPEGQELRSIPLPCGGFGYQSGIDVDDRNGAIVLSNGCLSFYDVEGNLVGTSSTGPGPVDAEKLPDGSVFLGFYDHVALVGANGQEKWRRGDRNQPGIFRNATDLFAADGGDLVVADGGNRRLQVFDSTGELKRLVPGFIGTVVAMDGQGNVYKAYGNHLAVERPEGTELIELYPDEGVWRFVLDILLDGDDILVALDDGSAATSGAEILRISSSNTTRFWVGGDFEAVPQVALTPDGDLLVALDPQDGNPGHLIRVLPTGEQERIDLAVGLLGGVVAAPDGGFLVTARGKIYRLDESGTVVRSLPLPDLPAYCTRLAVSGSTLYALDDALDAVYVYALD